jgi:hypothetical protein
MIVPGVGPVIATALHATVEMPVSLSPAVS